MTPAQIGVYGLGTMGSALALNMAEQGVRVAVTNREPDWLPPFMHEAGPLAAQITPHDSLESFVAGLETPRAILFMIPSGAPMEEMIEQVTPLLSEGDTLIDGGNADFHATRRRAKALAEHGLAFVGMGVSGGEAGARNGPSMMLGGPKASWARLEPILTAIAARHEGEPCVAHVGPDGAGHFVKTVHNGIEYADMQIIAEIYSLLRFGAGWEPARIGAQFAKWNEGALAAYLTEISAEILQATAADGAPFIDRITDAAGQKGTGRWTVIEALQLGQSASAIEAAVGARGWSSEKATREAAQALHGGERGRLMLDISALGEAFLAARMIGYAQGFRVLHAASVHYEWQLAPARIAEIWRAGCIIRSALLDEIAAAFHASPPSGELLLAKPYAARLQAAVPALRATVAASIGKGHAVPALAASLGWYDTMRQANGTANIIQAQRDFFGHHGFALLGQEGRHHGPWWE